MIKIIIGAPCSGKTTFTEEVSNPGDVIVDYDKLAYALGNKTSHNAEGVIKDVTHVVRQAAIEHILKGITGDAYIIHTNPTTEQIKKYKTAGASFILTDPGKETCLQRAEQRTPNTIHLINEWYDNPPKLPAGHTVDITKTRLQTLLKALQKG